MKITIVVIILMMIIIIIRVIVIITTIMIMLIIVMMIMKMILSVTGRPDWKRRRRGFARHPAQGQPAARADLEARVNFPPLTPAYQVEDEQQCVENKDQLLRCSNYSLGANYCTAELAKVSIHCEMPLTFPVKIHGTSHDPSTNVTETVKCHSRMPLQHPSGDAAEIRSRFRSVDDRCAAFLPPERQYTQFA